jgi:hypothetical protein
MMLKCTGQGIIRITRDERMSCPAGHELVQNSCYVNCPAGYHSKGSRCYADCPVGFIDTGSHCIKNSKARALGGLRQSGLKTITDDPRKSTITKRYPLGSNPNDRYKKQRISNMFGYSGGVDLFTSLTKNAQDFLVANKNDFCSGDDWNSPDTWLKFFALAVLLVGLIYAGPQIGAAIQSAFQGFFGLVTTVTTGVTEAEKVVGEGLRQGTKVVGEVAQGVVKTGSTFVEGAASGLESIQQSNAQSLINQQLADQNAQLMQRIQLLERIRDLTPAQ